MMKILFLLLGPIGLIGGLVGGHFLAPPAPETDEVMEEETAEMHDKGQTDHEATAEPGVRPATKRKAFVEGVPTEYAKITRQFVVPVIEGDRVHSLVVLNVAIEVDKGQSGLIAEHQPKLRDEFLKVLFDHAQSGGFSGSFTNTTAMNDLRLSLDEAANFVLGTVSRQVLITNIVRQDVTE